MKLHDLRLVNFRRYREGSVLRFGELTALVGRNDAGKSTFLDALNVVLGRGKLENEDVCVASEDGDVLTIECGFTELPGSLTLDAGSRTSLADEYLVDSEGVLRIQWRWKISVADSTRRVGLKPQILAVAHHPRARGVDSLHSKNNGKLKELVEAQGLQQECDRNNNASMRRALWHKAEQAEGLDLGMVAVDMAKEGGKTIWEQVQKTLPVYALFQSDRPSTDQDSEVQEPMATAVKTAMAELADETTNIENKVQERSFSTLKVVTTWSSWAT